MTLDDTDQGDRKYGEPVHLTTSAGRSENSANASNAIKLSLVKIMQKRRQSYFGHGQIVRTSED